MRVHVTPERQVDAAAASLIRLLPPAMPWFLRSLNRYPLPTIIAVAGALLVLRSTLRALATRR